MASLDRSKAVRFLLEDPALQPVRGTIVHLVVLLCLGPVLKRAWRTDSAKINCIAKTSVLCNLVFLTAFFLFVPIESPLSGRWDAFPFVLVFTLNLPEIAVLGGRWFGDFTAVYTPREVFKKIGLALAAFLLAQAACMAAWPPLVDFAAAHPCLLAALGAASIVLYIPASAAAYAYPSTITVCSEDRLARHSRILRIIAPVFCMLLRYVDIGLRSLPQRAKYAALVAVPLYGSLPLFMARRNATMATPSGARDAESRIALTRKSETIPESRCDKC